MGNAIAILTGAHVAGVPTFFPAADGDPKKHTLILNVMINGRKKKDGSRSVTTVPVKFWGKYATVAAHQLKVGSAINVFGVYTTWQRDTGEVKNGKKVIEEKTSVRCDEFFHAGMTNKQIAAMIDANLSAYYAGIAAGTIHPQTKLTSEMLMKKPELSVYGDYNPALAAQTGMYGYARVFVKGIGFLKGDGKVVQPAVPITNDPAAVDAIARRIIELQLEGKKVDLSTLKVAEKVEEVPAAQVDAGLDAFAAAAVVAG
jgi:hypothetical protein